MDIAATISRLTPHLTQLDGIGTLELEGQQRSETSERQNEDMIRQLASSCDFSAQSLRAMNPPQQTHKHIAQHFSIFDAHSNISSSSQFAPDKTNALDEESSRTNLCRKGAVHQTVYATLDSTHDNLPHSTSSIARSSNTCSNARSSNDLPSRIISLARSIISQSIPQSLPTN